MYRLPDGRLTETIGCYACADLAARSPEVDTDQFPNYVMNADK
jgi:hypothetical protein